MYCLFVFYFTLHKEGGDKILSLTQPNRNKDEIHGMSQMITSVDPNPKRHGPTCHGILSTGRTLKSYTKYILSQEHLHNQFHFIMILSHQELGFTGHKKILLSWCESLLLRCTSVCVSPFYRSPTTPILTSMCRHSVPYTS